MKTSKLEKLQDHYSKLSARLNGDISNSLYRELTRTLLELDRLIFLLNDSAVHTYKKSVIRSSLKECYLSAKTVLVEGKGYPVKNVIFTDSSVGAIGKVFPSIYAHFNF